MTDIIIDQDGGVRSTRFNDVYFSKSDPYAEAEYVFLDGTRFSEKVRNYERLCVGETGFGTGLNFLKALRVWKENCSPEGQLYYYSVDKYPLSVDEISQVWGGCSEVQEELSVLLQKYPNRLNGVHVLELMEGRVRLTLMWGDAAVMWNNVSAFMHVWFLDGFAPRENPEMWSEALFKAIAQCSHQNAQLATFTAAGFVRRGLENVGFSMKKMSGYGAKREMLVGTYDRVQTYRSDKPWFTINAPLTRGDKIRDKSAIVIGSGIAGCSVAYSLAKRGWKVTLLEKKHECALGASNHSHAVIFPAITQDMNCTTQISFMGYDYTSGILESLVHEFPDIYKEIPLVQLGKDAEDTRRIIAGAKCVDPHSDVMNIRSAEQVKEYASSVSESALIYERAKCVDVRELCKALISNSNINIKYFSEITEIKENLSEVFVESNDEKWRTQYVVICNAFEAGKFPISSYLPMQRARGQLTYLPKENVPKAFDAMLCYCGYAIPDKDHYILGATFDVNNMSEEIRYGDHVKNIKLLGNYCDVVFPNSEEIGLLKGKVGFRTMTADRLPIVGSLPDKQFFDNEYGDLHYGKRSSSYDLAQYHKGVYVSLAFGARGLVYAPLMGEHIASEMNGEPSVLCESYVHAVHPARFLIRDFKRNKSC